MAQPGTTGDAVGYIQHYLHNWRAGAGFLSLDNPGGAESMTARVFTVSPDMPVRGHRGHLFYTRRIPVAGNAGCVLPSAAWAMCTRPSPGATRTNPRAGLHVRLRAYNRD